MITVKEIYSRRDLRKFTSFPNKLYKANEYFVPAFTPDELNVFSKNNPVYDYCDFKCFLAYRDNKIVGRVAGIINRKLNEEFNKREIRFTRYDAIDDLDVARSLVAVIEKWGKEENMDTIIGPIGFTDMDRQGMLVDGFDEMSSFITIYNAPYYIDHMNELGFIKDVDWIEYQLPIPNRAPDKIERGANIARRRYGFELHKCKSKKEIKRLAYKAFETYNDALSLLYGFYPLSDHAINFYIKQVIQIVRADYIWFVLDPEENIAGFGVIMPSFTEPNKKSNGHLFPFGWARILKARKKHEVIDLYFIAISPIHQSKGLMGMLLEDAIYVLNSNGVKFAETGPELENNHAIHAQWRMFDGIRQHRRRRCWTKPIE